VIRTLKASSLLRRLYKSAAQRFISLTFVGMLLSLALDILIATRLGTGPATDALIIALSLPLSVEMVLRAGTNFSLVPVLIERQASLGRREFELFVSGLLNFVLVVGMGLTLVIELGAPFIATILAPGLTPEGRTNCILLLRVCAPMIVFALGITVLGVVLNAWRKFSLTALRSAVAPAVVLAALALLWNREDITFWLATAHVVGFGAFFYILLSGARKMGYRQHWSAWISKEDLRCVGQTISLPTLGFFVRQSTHFVDRFLASLMGAGSVSSYYFAFRIFSAVQTLIGYSIATTSLPAMSEQALAGSMGKMAGVIRRNLFYAILLILPVITFIMIFQEEIVRILYGRGAFSEESIQQTSDVLFWLSIGLSFACLIPVLTSGLFAQKALGRMFRIQAIAAGVNIVFAIVFSRIWGLNGIAAATSAASLFALGNLLLVLHLSGVAVLKGIRR
jgi:murein biosynthesis integral membrane protein MurJ